MGPELLPHTPFLPWSLSLMYVPKQTTDAHRFDMASLITLHRSGLFVKCHQQSWCLPPSPQPLLTEGFVALLRRTNNTGVLYKRTIGCFDLGSFCCWERTILNSHQIAQLSHGAKEARQCREVQGSKQRAEVERNSLGAGDQSNG